MDEEKKKKRKGIIKEFKEFVCRGNVLDLAIGIIIGGAFTAIVTALCDHVLKPVINWLLALMLGSESMDGVYTFLKKVTDAEGVVDLANSIYIDWGALINAIINFVLIAVVLFLIIKVVNQVHTVSEQAKANIKEKVEKRRAERVEIKSALEGNGEESEEEAEEVEIPEEGEEADAQADEDKEE